jgi:hypothetical protein
MFRKAQAARGFDPRMVQLLDLEMWFHLLEQGRLAHIADPLCAFREHAAQQTVANDRSGATAEESLTLAEIYFAKPWMKQVAPPRQIFTFFYNLRRENSAKAARFCAAMRQGISTREYVRCWLEYKITRPFKQIRRWFQKTGRPRQ